MSGNRQLALGSAGLTVIVGLIAALFIWPGYREAAAFRHQVQTLKFKISSLSDENQEVDLLEQQVKHMQRSVSTNLKTIPDVPDQAELMSKLSLPVDGVSVVEQTFTVLGTEDLVTGDKKPLKAMPLKVELTASFESIFALIRAAESMNRLMRVSSVKVVCKRDDKNADAVPLLNASIGFEAIYDPPFTSEEGH